MHWVYLLALTFIVVSEVKCSRLFGRRINAITNELCSPRDDNFGHYTCSPKTGKIVCMSGWTGDYCIQPRCLEGCKNTHGYCNKPNECRCFPGWSGPLCDKCELYPGCIHGTCQEPWKCDCEEGWGGLFCKEKVNRNVSDCEPRDDKFGHYICSPTTGKRVCLPGWEGTNCTKPRCLTGCRNTHGHCNKPNECKCFPGWIGPVCDKCERYPGCIHGTCQKPYQCKCDKGWVGRLCNQKLKDEYVG